MNKIIMVLAIIFSFTVGAIWQPRVTEIPVPYTEGQVGSATSEQSITQAVNDYRVSNNKSALEFDATLNKSATLRAEEIASSNKWSHTRPDGSYFSTSVEDWQYKYEQVGENLAKCYPNTSETLKAWELSPTHNTVMLSEWTHIGVATEWDVDQNCMIYVTHFSR